MRALLWLLLAVLLLSGLGFFFYTIFFASLAPVARQAFSTAHSCPEERMISRERPDLRSYDLTFGPPPANEPPADVRADPARLGVWEATRREEQERREAWNSGGMIVEVEGCDRRELYVCYRSAYNTGGDGWPFCTPVAPQFLPASDDAKR